MASTPLSILVIEDNPDMLAVAMETLAGNEKVGAHNGKVGFTRFKEYCPDITFLDLGLPDMDGFELLKDIKSYDPEAFVVVLTRSNLAQDVKQAKELGAMGYIAKPFSRKKILDVIAAYQHYHDTLKQMQPEERMEKMLQELQHDIEKKYLPVRKSKQKKEDAGEEEAIVSFREKDRKQQEPQKPEIPTKEALLSTWRILFVDDYLVNRQRAVAHLSKLGCAVDIAQDGYEAMEKFNQMSYNLMFIDTDINGEDGYMLAQDMRAKEKELGRKEIPMIALVENHAEIEDKRWLKVGMNEYVIKPMSFVHLRGLVEKHAQYQIALLKEVV